MYVIARANSLSSILEQEITFVDLENRNAVLVVAANANFLNYWSSAFFSCTIFFLW
jgi:hypothetical protein